METQGGLKLDFAAVVTQYEAPLLRYVARLLPADAGEQAEDIVQEAFLRLHKQVGKANGGGIANMRTWLYCVSRNLALDARRKTMRNRKARQALKAEADCPPASGDLADGLAHKEFCERAMAELAGLPEKQREAIFLKVTQDLKFREIAVIMDTSVSNVAYHLNNGLQSLAKRLKSAGSL